MLLSWQNLTEYAATFSAVVAGVTFILWQWLKPKIDKEFATQEALDNEVTRSKARESAIEQRLQESLNGYERRLSKMEADLKTLPTKDDLHNLAVQIAQQAGAISSLSVAVKSIDEGVTRIEDYLLAKGK